MNFDMQGVSVALEMPTHRDISPYTVRALLETQAMFLQRGTPIDIQMQSGSSLVHHARSKAAWQFLQSGRSHLFWVDSDIEWKASDFLKLLALGTKLPCVCAIYPAKRDPPQFYLNVDDPNANVELNEYGCFPVRGAGLGFTVVQRHVMEELAEKAPKVRFPDTGGEAIPHIFRCDIVDGDARGEDMAFFSDIRDLGYDVMVDPSITLGHIGPKVFSASLQDLLSPVR